MNGHGTVIGSTSCSFSAFSPSTLRLMSSVSAGYPNVCLELGADLERSERLDLVLRGAVEQRVGAPQHVVLADVGEQLPEHVRGLVG